MLLGHAAKVRHIRTVRPVDKSTLAIDFRWRGHGTVEADAGTIRFEDAPRLPRLYRIDLDEHHRYIGEARSLAGRFGGYRNPGGSANTLVPRTNRRVQRKILEALAAGRSVPVWLCTEAEVTLGRATTALSLDNRTHRLLIESAAIVLGAQDGCTLENLARR